MINEFGRKMAIARKRAGVTQRQIAEAKGWTQAMVSRFETANANPTYKTMSELAELIGCTIEFVPKDR